MMTNLHTAAKQALGKIKSARDCHPNAVDTLLFEAEEILEASLAEQPAYRAVKTFHEGKPVYVAEQPAQQESDHQFKNFHRNLCERFGYSHDEKDWKRDQVSLIEWIAKKVEQPAQQEPVAWREHVEQRLLTWRQSFINKSGDQLVLDDFMDKRSLDDLIDFVCDEYTNPQAREPEQPAQQDVSLINEGKTVQQGKA